MATGTHIADPDFRYYQHIETGVEVEVEHSSYEERDTNYFEETFVCEELDQEWYREDKMVAWFEANGYISEY